MTKDLTIKPVKNLGWLLRNHHKVTRFDLIDIQGGYMGTEGKMIAYLEDDRLLYFVALWACRDLMLKWVDRPVFRGMSGVDRLTVRPSPKPYKKED
jgi:hypothetical protein